MARTQVFKRFWQTWLYRNLYDWKRIVETQCVMEAKSLVHLVVFAATDDNDDDADDDDDDDINSDDDDDTDAEVDDDINSDDDDHTDDEDDTDADVNADDDDTDGDDKADGSFLFNETVPLIESRSSQVLHETEFA